MTTIAYDGQTLAGDTLASYGDTALRNLEYHKVLCNVGNYKAVGLAGNFAQGSLVLDWLREGEKKNKKPTVEGCRFLLIDHYNRCWLLTNELVPQEVPVPFAIGSGENFAIGAMSMGATAKQAVEVAAKWDLATGGKVDEIKIT